nr:phospholipase-like protein [Tanacetum cinerariifolium]
IGYNCGYLLKRRKVLVVPGVPKLNLSRNVDLMPHPPPYSVQIVVVMQSHYLLRDYLVEEELRLCLEEEESIRSEQEKIIQQEKSFRLEEAKRMRLEEEKKLQIAEVNKRKRLEFMNSTHVKNILGKFTPTTRNDVHYVVGKTKPKESWVKIKKYRENLNDPSLDELLKRLNHGLRPIGAGFFMGISEDGERGLPVGFLRVLMWKKRRKKGDLVSAGKNVRNSVF